MKPWTTLEMEALRYLGPRLGGLETAAALERSYGSVRHRASQLGVRLCRSITLGTDSGQQTPEYVLRRVRQLATAPLCPSCARRPASVPRTGLCAPCHHATRVAISEEEIERQEALRLRWAARSRLQRLRRSNDRAKPDMEFPYWWRVRTHLPERFGQRCAVLCRGAMNSCAVEFEDGYRVVTSRWYVRKAPAPNEGAPE